MLVSYQQPLTYRRPIRVGWAKYGRLWLGYHADQLKHRLQPMTAVLGHAAAGAWSRASGVAVAVAVGVERIRPRPFTDLGLLMLAALTGVAALAVAVSLAQPLAAWMMTAPDDVTPASVGVLVIGAAFLGLAFLVFASKRQRRHQTSRTRIGR